MAYVLGFRPLERHPERIVVRDALTYDAKGKQELSFLLEEEIWGPTGEPCALCLMLSSERLNFAKVRETQNKQRAKYRVPLCCSHKGWLTFRGQEDWDLMQEKMGWSHLRFRESASSMQLLLELCVDDCVLEEGFSLYRE